MKRIRIQRPTDPRQGAWLKVLPSDPRDPDILRASGSAPMTQIRMLAPYPAAPSRSTNPFEDGCLSEVSPISRFRNSLLDVKTACERARAAEILHETGSEDRWLFAKTYFDRLASDTADEIEPRWVDRLGGVRAFTHDHWAAMLMAMAHDWGVEAGR